MDNYIKKIASNINISEGTLKIEQFLTTLYFDSPLSNKKLAQTLLLPTPLIVAIKQEFIKHGLLKQDKGAMITSKGIKYIENHLGYKDIDKEFYQKIKNDFNHLETSFHQEFIALKNIFKNRSKVDRSIDQAHSTYTTSFKRALLSVHYNSLINKKILCVGDDDLVSLSLALLLKRLYKGKAHHTQIHVIDIDSRLLSFIKKVSTSLNLNITCHHANFKEPLSQKLRNSFDCFYTDPPYTVNGLKLFLSKGIFCLKQQKGLPIFFSFAHRSYDDTYEIMNQFMEMGLSIHKVTPSFNEYEGASIHGKVSQLFILHTTSFTQLNIRENETFNKSLYTSEIRNNKNIKINGTYHERKRNLSL